MKNPPKLKQPPKPRKPPTPKQVARDLERNLKDGPIVATERAVKRTEREVKRIIPK